MAGGIDGSPECCSLKGEHLTVKSVLFLLSSRTLSQYFNASKHTPPSCKANRMDHASAGLNRENDNTGVLFTGVSVINVSTKQTRLTLVCSKSLFTNLIFQHFLTSIKLPGEQLVLATLHFLPEDRPQG